MPTYAFKGRNRLNEMVSGEKIAAACNPPVWSNVDCALRIADGRASSTSRLTLNISVFFVTSRQTLSIVCLPQSPHELDI